MLPALLIPHPIPTQAPLYDPQNAENRRTTAVLGLQPHTSRLQLLYVSYVSICFCGPPEKTRGGGGGGYLLPKQCPTYDDSIRANFQVLRPRAAGSRKEEQLASRALGGSWLGFRV